MHGLTLTGVGEVVDLQELLGAQVEGAGELAREEASVASGEVAEGG